MFVSQSVPYTQLDFYAGGQTQAERWLWRDILTTDLVPVQTQRLQFGEVGHIHNAAETTQRELYSHKTKRQVVMNLFLHICGHDSLQMSRHLLQCTTPVIILQTANISWSHDKWTMCAFYLWSGLLADRDVAAWCWLEGFSPVCWSLSLAQSVQSHWRCWEGCPCLWAGCEPSWCTAAERNDSGSPLVQSQ